MLLEAGFITVYRDTDRNSAANAACSSPKLDLKLFRTLDNLLCQAKIDTLERQFGASFADRGPENARFRMKTLAVVLEEPERLAQPTPLPEPGEDDVVVDVEWSGISTGTERLLWSGRCRPSPAWVIRSCPATRLGRPHP